MMYNIATVDDTKQMYKFVIIIQSIDNNNININKSDIEQ